MKLLIFEIAWQGGWPRGLKGDDKPYQIFVFAKAKIKNQNFQYIKRGPSQTNTFDR